MMTFLHVFVIFLVCAGMASAADDLSKLQESIDIYNSIMEKAPSMIRAQLGDERINAAIVLNNGSTISWGFETKEQKIVRSERGGIENSTIDVYTTEDVIDRVENANDPLAVYRDAEKSGEVSVKGNTMGSKIKLSVILSSDEAIKFFFGIISKVRAPISG
jgi:hypothetical protein